MEISERLEKQMEGTNLALAAVAEVLQKMDARLIKEDEEDEEEEMQKAAEVQRADLVKSIASEVVTFLKQGTDTEEKGMDVDPSERKAKGTGGSPQNADDSESAVTPTTKIEDQQSTIQAMLKGEDDEEEDMDDMEGKGHYAVKEGDDEAADYPVEEDAPDDDDDSDGMKAMKSQIEAMKKQLEAYEAGMQKAVQTESESRLRKMGFSEDTSLKSPEITTPMGVDGVAPIQKSTPSTDVAADLTNISYGELRKWQHQIEMGETDGVPRELLEN